MTSAFADPYLMEGHYNYMPHGGFYANDQSPAISPSLYGPPLLQIDSHSAENLHHYADYDDNGLPLVSPQDGPKSKRRQSHGADHIKHKRTRSGCLTCRARRVKCDEAHPTCERCRKGQRDCVYPEPNNQRPPRDPSKYKSNAADSASNSSGDEVDLSESQKLPAILDEDDEDGAIGKAGPSANASAVPKPAHDSMSPSSKERTPNSPPESSKKTAPKRPQPSRSSSKQQHGKSISFSGPKWATLPKDIRMYIKYHRENITCHHYALKYDETNFLKTTFIEIALSYEPLLYAITAFSAYFHTLSRPDGKIQTFISYYNKSVSLLRESLSKSSRHSTATLLTILQLATFEEYLGDWVNIFNHQKAAYEILTQLFTPETVMQNETRRKIVSWYMRFDIVTGFVAGSETVLGREWHAAVTDYYIRQAVDKPNDLGCIIEETFAKTGLVAFDIALLFGKKAKGAISDADFMASVSAIKTQMDERDIQLDMAFSGTREYVKEFPNAPTGDWVDIFGSTNPDYLLADSLWTWNLAMIDWYGIKLMFLGQMQQIEQTQNPMQLVELGYKICQTFEGFEFAGKNKQADVLAVHASLGVAMTTLPRDDVHKDWCRRKLALIESCGYFHPPSFRTRMSELWGLDVTSSWWLEDNESYKPILQSMREFIDYRALHPNDAHTDSLRDLRGVFKAMNLEDDPYRNGGKSRSASSVTTDEGFGGVNMEFWTSLESSPEMNWDGALSSADVHQGEWAS